MRHDIPILRSLDPHHSRLGYLGALAVAAVRTLDTYDALVARVSDTLFERYYTDEPRFAVSMSHVAPSDQAELLGRMLRDAEDNPAAILSPLEGAEGWLTRSEFWLFDRKMPSHIGYLTAKHIGRVVDFARWTGVLLPTLDLSETGFLLQYLTAGGVTANGGECNQLYVTARPALVLLYLRLLLASDVLFPSLLCEFAARVRAGSPIATRGEAGLLRATVDRVMAAIGEPVDPEDVLAFRELREFNDAVLGSRSTEENYLRPRLEILVDLGLVERTVESPDKRGAFPWMLPSASLELSDRWSSLAGHPQHVDEFLDTQLVTTTAPALGLRLRTCSGVEALDWFAKAYSCVGREIGFTPGRTIAQLASLLAAEGGVQLEVKGMYDCIYAVPSGPYADFFQFSGGSRFDQEFMIKVLPGLSARVADDILALHDDGGRTK